ncbi:hypothetical protein [Peribacillus butanolivorans]|jgi:hypothetical protein|nr:hypothetical protein [Peribacillus butanolivorans]
MVENAFQSAKQPLLDKNRPSAVFTTDDLKVMSIYIAFAEIIVQDSVASV